MRHYHAEVFLDQKPTHQGTVSATEPHTAAGRALELAMEKQKSGKRHPELYTVRLRLLKSPTASAAQED